MRKSHERFISAAIVLTAIALWELLVRVKEIPPFILPAPSLVASTLASDWGTLFPALLVTLKITLLALLLAVVGGVALAFLFTLSRALEVGLFPFAIILQVTPIIAIAPLILIYLPDTLSALLLCAWIVAFFPILSNTVTGLRSADRNLRDLFTLYGATGVQRLRLLLVPSALPYFLAGLKVAGGLALIGAVVAEFAAGTSGKESGLAWRILEASFRLNTPRMFAALALVSCTGIALFAGLSALTRAVLGHWHESEMQPDA